METGRIFTKENGELLHPGNVTRRFVERYEEIDLPPVRLHDLRHGAATLAHAAGTDLLISSDCCRMLIPAVGRWHAVRAGWRADRRAAAVS